MKKFEAFLERVKDLNTDEFGELNEILGRHKQLSDKNKELRDTQDKYQTELDKRIKEFSSYKKDHGS